MTTYAAMITTDNASNEITFTNEEYLKQLDVIARDAADELARAIWESVKRDAEEYWKFEERLRNRKHPSDLHIKSHNSKFVAVLDTYKKTFEAIGCTFNYDTDYTDPCERVCTVKATGIFGNTLGYLISYGNDSWWK